MAAASRAVREAAVRTRATPPAAVVNRVLSGIQPTGVPTLGNYLGALQTWLKLQAFFDSTQGGSGELGGAAKSVERALAPGQSTEGAARDQSNRVLFMVADSHSLTTTHDPEHLRNGIRDLTATMLASGIDPAKSSIFQQSDVPAHAELAWILQCNTPLGWLNRMTQFKDKSGKNRDTANLGLLAYPTLMAADILVYQASHVPVGDDQTQHLEFTRDIAKRMNDMYGADLFALPKAIKPATEVARVMSLRDGRKKMSKSDPSDQSRITMVDTADEISVKIRKAKTDALGNVSSRFTAEERPEVFNLLHILAALSGKPTPEVIAAYEGSPIQDLKRDLADVAVATICPIGDEINRLRSDAAYLESVLRSGAGVAKSISSSTVDRVKAAVGLTLFQRPPPS